MKYSYKAIAASALVGAAAAAKDSRTFAVMRFNGDPVFQGPVDPIVNPGGQSTHEHTVFGGSNFGPDATGESMMQSRCTSAKLKGDKSAYWAPTVFFHDEAAGTFERVPVSYANVYYFFEPTDDEIEPFPTGLSMLVGDVNLRTPPKATTQNLDAGKGDIGAVFFTCPRQNYDSPAWVVGSDGSTAGKQDPVHRAQGMGFPAINCDADFSPLRADIHFPSCYDPSKDVADYKNNMAWPTFSGYKENCPPGFIHVPHIFMEVYWDTQKFADRWTPNENGDQPFVLSNGDVTGYSNHADFLAAWDQDLLKHIIDTCDAKHAGMEHCPGVEQHVNTESCRCEGSVVSMASASTGKLTSLPGGNQLSGFKYGAAPAPASHAVAQQAAAHKPADDEEDKPAPVEVEEDNSEVEAPLPEPAAPEPTEEPQCVTKTKVVMETVTVYEDAEPTVDARRRHVHRHQARHHRRI